jgi:uncharacterized protein YutE (UPF0331/DUF86 family)
MVDQDKVQRLLAVLLDAIADLRRYRTTLTRDQLRSSRDAQHMVLHALYVATQACVDLAMHAIADAGLPQAPTYQSAFAILAEAGLIAPTLAERLAGWAGFRNVLAHFYSVVSYDRVYDALGEVDDLEKFAAVVTKLAEEPAT